MTARVRPALVVTCEHASWQVPPAWEHALHPNHALLHTHRGHDRGAVGVAATLARALRAPLVAATWTRLLVDPNRSPGNPGALSEFTRRLPRAERVRLWAELHAPHWAAVRRALARARRGGRRRCVHVGVHSFTPVRDGHRRTTDVGILYDPRRPAELAFARAWQSALRAALPSGLRVHRNRPYAGWSDGLTTAMRAELPLSGYIGIELEINQRLVTDRPSPRWDAVQRACVETLRGLLNGWI